ncbi:3-mercaptopyruvate sulfurtransferase [Phenylobacterium sp.]|uniref:3-mercaptopyruvate sulfurtransferase n=1 Tax=Phenylobacterium sp. TaxID=1871053 RepID=UPI0035633BAC
MSDPLVSTAWLAERLDDPAIRIVDGSWWMPAEARSGRAEYLEAHIPGAVFFDIDKIADRATDLPHMLPSPEAFAQAVGQLGLSRDATVVAYDSFGVRAAARVWWTLRVMGFEKVFVLDGGFRAWRAEGRPVESGDLAAKPVAVGHAFEPALLRNLDDVRALIGSSAEQIVDARGGPRFRGEVPEPREGVRSGHMPGARNIPFDSLLEPDGRMKPAAELASIFREAGVDLDRPIVTTCGSGITASVLALALARIGRDRAAVYDGSWTEWGARPDTAVVTGA